MDTKDKRDTINTRDTRDNWDSSDTRDIMETSLTLYTSCSTMVKTVPCVRRVVEYPLDTGRRGRGGEEGALVLGGSNGCSRH